MKKYSDFINSCFRNIERIDDLGTGRNRRYIAVGTTRDAQTSKFLFKSKVKHVWPSQWHSRYPEGFVMFYNGRIFDIARGTIDGRSVFLFFYEKVEVWYSRNFQKEKIIEEARIARTRDVFALAELAVELAPMSRRPWIYGRDAALRVLVGRFDALSLAQLADLGSLLQQEAT